MIKDLSKDFVWYTEKPNRIALTVLGIEKLPRGRYKVKVAETDVNLKDMIHKGKSYIVSKNLGRGRYIMGAIQ